MGYVIDNYHITKDGEWAIYIEDDVCRWFIPTYMFMVDKELACYFPREEHEQYLKGIEEMKQAERELLYGKTNERILDKHYNSFVNPTK